MRFAQLTLVAALIGGAAACEVNYEVDPNFGSVDGSVDTSGGEVATDSEIDTTPPGDGACASNLDCAGKLDTPLCDVTTGACVECLTSDRCAKAQWCNKGACVAGCKDDTDCKTSTGDAGVGDAKADGADVSISVLSCDLTTHMCRGCKADSECPASFLCTVSDGLCRPGCNPTHACATGAECCDSQCVDTKTSAAHCGACGKACAGPSHTTMKCEASECKVSACDMGWANCNSMDADGCETDIATKVETCGGCATPCTIANGTGACDAGKCKVATCAAGFDDCDKNPANGCEAALNTTDHCGMCGLKCAPTNAVGTCATGTCAIASCNAGFGNCDGSAGNGCETNLKTNTSHCNACGNVCPSTTGTPACVAGVCKYSTCSAGLGDCDGSGACATPITNDISNCGACGRTCSVANGSAKCTGTACGVNTCTPGFDDCNSSYIDGCETNLGTLSNCGACGVPCARANAAASCTTGTCTLGTCNPNFGNCDMDDSNGCEKSLLADPANCGLCGRTCTVTNGTGTCTAGSCTLVSCNAGYANCDANPDTCERNLGAPENTCGTATVINDSGGGATFLGCRTTETGTVTTGTSKFFKVTLTSACGGAGCKASDPLRARFALTNPTGVDYDLFVYTSSACSSPVASGATVGGAGETVQYQHATCPGTLDLWVEVRWKSGSSCTNASLTVTSAY